MNKMKNDLICVAPVSAQRVLILPILVRLTIKRKLQQRQERAMQEGQASTSSLVKTEKTICDKKCWGNSTPLVKEKIYQRKR